MAHSPDDITRAPAPPARFCTRCGEQSEPDWAFCAICGAPVPADRDPEPQSTTPPAEPLTTSPDGNATLLTTSHEDIVYPPGYSPTAATRRRRRRKRRFWRRPLFLVPMIFLLLFVSGAGAVVYRTNGVMSNLRTISTPPPVVTDSTYMEEDDPDMPAGPITVDTGPAREAISAVANTRSLPKPQDTGFSARLKNVSSGVSDIANAASVAGGIRATSQPGFTMLVMGVDARPGAAIDIGVRPDVMMLIHFDPNSHSCRMLSIPRDTRVELPGYGQTKINHALMVGGIPYQLLVTEDFIGTPIDHYVLVDFQAFERAVDVVGGVDVVIEKDLEKNGQVQYTAGPRVMNGEEALAYARFRTPSDQGDTGRVKRQWSILGGLAHAAQGRELVSDVNTLVPTVEDHIRTDLTLTEMATIARDYGDKCLKIDRDDIAMTEGTRVQFNDPILEQRLYYNVVKDATVEQRIDELLNGHSTTPPTPATPVPDAPATPSARWVPLRSSSMS